MTVPTLSAVMTNYNHAHFLPEAVQSILSQSYQPSELIIIDDASTDNSFEILEQFAQKHPFIRLIRNEQNRGVLYNLQRLLELASGDYFVGLASDDKFLPGYLEKSMCLLQQYPQAGFCATPTRLIDEAGRDIGLAPTPIISNKPCFLSPTESLQILRQHGHWFPGNTSVYRRQALIEAGGYIAELRSYCDGFISEVLALKYGACYIPEPLGAWRWLGTGYFSSTMANVDLSQEIMGQAKQLMQTTYRELFPPDYIAIWEKHWLYTTNVCVLNNLQNEQQRYLAKLNRLFPTPTLPDRLFLATQRVLLKIQYASARLYLFARLRRKTWELIRRRLIGRPRLNSRL
jgi:glycosyltransferase involved in cell wall biosynthesis